ncbi:hypothetical protein R50076_32710 [Gilvimarinus japonicus]
MVPANRQQKDDKKIQERGAIEIIKRNAAPFEGGQTDVSHNSIVSPLSLGSNRVEPRADSGLVSSRSGVVN